MMTIGSPEVEKSDIRLTNAQKKNWLLESVTYFITIKG